MRQLGRLEAEVMQCLWSAERPLSVRDVLDDLSRRRKLAYTTVMTVMDNLHGKDLVVREKRGRAYVYAPSSTREEHTARLLDNVLADSRDRGAALLHFVGRLSDEDAADLRAALARLESSGPTEAGS